MPTESTAPGASFQGAGKASSARIALATLRQQLRELGYASVFDVIRLGRRQTVARLTQTAGGMLDAEQANAFYDQVQARAASLARLYSQLGARAEPVIRALGKLDVAYDATWMARALGTGANYEDWFKPPAGTVNPDSVGSLFSPASYLTTLYRAARPLHPPAHGLQVDRRRPDLRALKLTDTHLNLELSTLALTLEVLEAGVNDSDPNTDVDTKLREAVYPMTLPYNHATEQIRQGLAVKKTSAAQLWAALGDHEGAALKRTANLSAWSARLNPSFVQDVLGINPELYRILAQGYVGYIEAGKYLGFDHTGQITDEIKLQAGLRLPTERVLEALGTGPYFGFRLGGSLNVVPTSFTIGIPSTVLKITPERIPFIHRFSSPTEDGFLSLELTISWLGITEVSPGGTLWLKARLELLAFKQLPIGEIQDEFTVSLFRQGGSMGDDAHAMGTKARPFDGEDRAKEVDYDLGITAAQLLPGKSYIADLRWKDRHFSIVGRFDIFHALPDRYEAEALVSGLVAEKRAGSDDLVLRFQSTVKVDAAETDDYAWSLTAVDALGEIPGMATPAKSEQTVVRARQWEFPLGYLLETFPPGGVTFQLKLTWQQGRREAWRSLSVYADISSASSLLSPQTYGARYLNGWVSSNPDNDTYPFYWYIGPQLGHPVPRPTNSPPESLLYHRHGPPYERLNRVVRLWQKLPVSFEELD